MTLALIIIPAIDILDGKVVRVKQGREDTARNYSDEPIKVARDFLDNGASIVHVVDLNAAIRGDLSTNRQILQNLLSTLRGSKLRVEIAGGIRNDSIVQEFVQMGASRIVIGSIVYENLDIAKSILDSIGDGRTVLALDYDEGGFVRTHGWKSKENERVEDALGRFKSLGFNQFLITSVKHDGMLQGPDFLTLGKLRSKFRIGNVRLIASGGVSSESDLKTLSQIGVDEVIVGKALYEGTIAKSVLSTYN